MKKTTLKHLALVLILFFCIPFLGNFTYGQEQCLKDVFKSFNEKDYESTINHANDCIDNFGRMAIKLQDKLTKKFPPGSHSEEDNKKIFSQGLVNDVAASYFYKGRAAEYLYKKSNDDSEKNKYKKMAEEAYNNTCNLDYGLVWDPKGWFWSPCEAASLRLPIE